MVASKNSKSSANFENTKFSSKMKVELIRIAYKRVSRPSSLNRPSWSKMPSTDSPEEEEHASLLDGQPRKRFCSFRVDGPDGVWSWLVAFANFLVNFIIVGLGRMSGILYIEFMHIFNIDRMTASVPFSIQQAGRNLFGPVAGILGQKYGMRAVTILGGIIGALSSAIIYFKMNVTSITILWGLFFGLSTALTTTLNQISIDQYFEKHRATAGGFAFSGGCVGAFFFPIVIETLIDHYTLRGMFLVLGAIVLLVVAAAVMMAEPPWQQDQRRTSQNVTSYGAFEAGEPSTSDDSIETIKANNKITKAETKMSPVGIDFTILQDNSDMVFQFLTMNTSVRPEIDKQPLLNDLECIYASVANAEQKSSENESSDILSFDSEEDDGEHISKLHDGYIVSEDVTNENNSSRPFNHDVPRRVFIQIKLKELYHAKGLQLVSHFTYLDQPRAWKILMELRKLYETLNDKPYLQTAYMKTQHFRSSKPKTTNKPRGNLDTKEHSNTFCNHLKTAVKLHSNPLFLLICICRGVFMLTFIPVVTIIVDFAMDKGLPKSDGKYVVAVLSLGDLIGRLCFGWITDRGCLSLPRYMLVVMIILGVSTATLPLMTSRASFMIAIIIFGILQGSLFVRHALLVTHYMESHEQSIGMGFINFLSGFLGFALPSFIGYFRDTLGSYDNMFYLNGILCGVVGLMWFLEPLFLHIIEKCNARKSDIAVSDI